MTTGIVMPREDAQQGRGHPALARRALAGACVWIALLVLLVASPPGLAKPGATLVGRVTGISDGDTLTVVVGREPIRVRLAEIDTPERGQPWGNRAKQALSAKVFGQVVELEVLDKDGDGRTVARVFRDGRSITRELVREGHAWVYPKYLRDPTLLDDEASARARRAGLWSLPEAERIPPWSWRHGAQPRRLSSDGAPRSDERAAFSCGAKVYCREMSSCDEALFQLNECGLRRLDGDGDGVPCETICRRRD